MRRAFGFAAIPVIGLLALAGFLGLTSAHAVTGAAVADFDGDTKTDRSFFRPSSGVWNVHQSTGGDTATAYGTTGDTPVPGDYDGDGKVDTAIFRPATGLWVIGNSGGGGNTFLNYGTSTDVPVPADYDNDGKADIAVYRPSTGTWFVHKSTGGDTAVTFGGISQDLPVPADYDGDGKADLAIFRLGVWFVHPSLGGGDTALNYGLSKDIPVVGDYDADGKADVAIWRPSTGLWATHESSGGDTFATYGGVGGDVPAPGKYDSDGKTDMAIFRPADAWYVHQSSDDTDSRVEFGTVGDIPLPLPAAVYSRVLNPVNDPPIVSDKSHNVTGNVQIVVPAGSGLLVGVTDVEGNTLSAQLDATNASAGNVVINADGSYSYNPKPGSNAADTVKFKVCDNGSPVACSAVHNLNLTVSGMIWFVDNNAGAAGDGRSTTPFNTLAGFQAVNDGVGDHPAAGDSIFIDRAVATDYTGPVTLLNNQKLFGKGATANIPTLAGITLAPDSLALPATSGTAPNIVTTTGILNAVNLGQDNTVRGLSLGSTTGSGLAGNTFGTLTASENAVGPTRTGQALNLSNGIANATFTDVSSSSSGSAVVLQTVSGTLAINGGAISGATGSDFVVSGGSSGTITYAGSITNTASLAVDVQNRAGGTISFTGAISATSGHGVFLNNNTGATITFNGTLNLSTGVNPAFIATGGGTVNVLGSDNVLATTTGTALNVVNTTIGASGLTFKSISSNGATNGILLDSTGSSGGLTVAGTGSAGSGGTIQNSTDSGVLATTTTNLNLSWMTIQNNGNALAEDGVRLVNMFGAGQLTSSTVTGSFEDNVYLSNSSGTLGGFNIQGPSCSIGNNNTSSGNTGVSVLATLTSTMNVTINDCAFSGNRSDTIHTDTADSSILTTTITNNVITAGTGAANQGNIGIDVSSAFTSTLTYDVENNKIGTDGVTNAPLLNHGINVFAGNTSTASGKVINNTIRLAGATFNGTGIRLFQSDSGTLNSKVSGNTVSNVGLDFGIDATDNGSGTGPSTGKLNVGLANNNVSVLSAAINAIRVRGRRDTTTCTSIAGNTATTNGGGNALSISQANTASYKFEIVPPPPLGALTDAQAAAEAGSLNPGAVGAEASSATGTGITGVAVGTCTGIPS